MSHVSVIIPICRTGKYLSQLFASLQKVELGEHQMMLSYVIDYSDQQQQDVEAFMAALNEYRGFWNPAWQGNVDFVVSTPEKNLGLAGARNLGIKNTQNGLHPEDYILWMDSDDLFTPESIIRRIEFMNANPDVDFAYGSYLTFKDDQIEGPYGDPEIKPFNAVEVLKQNQFSTCAGIIRSPKFIPFDERARVAEDYVWVLTHLHEYHWAFIPNLHCFYYRIRPDSLSNDPESQKLHYSNVIKAKRVAYKNLLAQGVLPPDFKF